MKFPPHVSDEARDFIGSALTKVRLLLNLLATLPAFGLHAFGLPSSCPTQLNFGRLYHLDTNRPPARARPCSS